MIIPPSDLPALLHAARETAQELAEDSRLRMLLPRAAYKARRIVELLDAATKEQEREQVHTRAPSANELGHRQHELHRAGVATPRHWWSAPANKSAAD